MTRDTGPFHMSPGPLTKLNGCVALSKHYPTLSTSLLLKNRTGWVVIDSYDSFIYSRALLTGERVDQSRNTRLMVYSKHQVLMELNHARAWENLRCPNLPRDQKLKRKHKPAPG